MNLGLPSFAVRPGLLFSQAVLIVDFVSIAIIEWGIVLGTSFNFRLLIIAVAD